MKHGEQCYLCKGEKGLDFVEKEEEIVLRGRVYRVPAPLFVCRDCGAQFNAEHDPADLAYRRYRDDIGILQPEDIIAHREKHNLSQEDLSKLVNQSVQTVKRYETDP